VIRSNWKEFIFRLTRMIRSRPERKRSVWNRYAECSCSLGILRASTHFAMALTSLSCVVYSVISVESVHILEAAPKYIDLRSSSLLRIRLLLSCLQALLVSRRYSRWSQKGPKSCYLGGRTPRNNPCKCPRAPVSTSCKFVAGEVIR